MLAPLLTLWLAAPAPDATVDAATAARFAQLALDCVGREYPNKLSHLLNGPGDVKAPHELTPAFFGCYDWHSAVHAHWLLARLARRFPDAAFAGPARAALAHSLTAEQLAAEASYLSGPGRASFERPYGLAWLLQLHAELLEWKDPEAQAWADRLAQALVPAAVARLSDWLPKLANPIRIGEHNQTAFSLGLVLDWARLARARDVEDRVDDRIRAFYSADRACPLAYEPSGEDFLSPCLAEADLMRRVLAPRAFATWLEMFLPSIPRDGAAWLAPAVVVDPSDPKLAHLDGLNLSRAWMLEGIASGLPTDDARLAALRRAAAAHRSAGIAAVTGAHYEGGHWLGTFAVYLVTRRGIATR